MSAQGDYILGEVKHLASYGLTPVYISQVLEKKPATLAKFLRKRGEIELAIKFEKARRETE